jgi:hypothetical protein
MKASFIYNSIALLVLISCYSCKKDLSCETCRDGNSPPRAVAGPDQVIKLPADSVLLDGSASSDPNGSISKYAWRKIAGPVACNIISPADSITRVRSLIAGIYQFELTVTDKVGLSSMDTVQVTVNDTGQTNRPPIANAGPDKVVSDSLILDGSGSTDPDNNITSYQWTKISGPSSANISNPNVARTLVSNPHAGVYLFALKVTDAGGLFSSDTVEISFIEPELKVACDNSIRPIIDAQLIPVTSFPSGNENEFVVIDNKVYFMTMECPNCIGATKKRAYYNIFDLVTQTWSKSSEYLMTPRKYGASIIASGNRIFYAGGLQSNPPNYSAVFPDVNIYDVTNNTWSSAKLSAGGANIAAAVAGNKVLFAGGLRDHPDKIAKPSAIVDIFDLSTNTWSVTSLSQGRSDISVVSSNGKIYFAGGSSGDNAIMGFLGATNAIDIYDYATNTWTVSVLAEDKTYLAGIAVGNKIYWAGGLGPWEDWEQSVEIRDIQTQQSSRACLLQTKFWWANQKGAAFINNKIVFFTGVAVSNSGYNTRFDIYDVNSNSWLVGQLPVDIGGASIFSYNNTIYVVGGMVNGAVSTRIWKLVF